MATLTIELTIPDAKQNPVINAFCARRGYDSESGLTKLQFIKKEVATFLKEAYIEEKREIELQNARTVAAADFNSFDITT